MMFFLLNKVKNGPIRTILAELGGTPLPPLTENHPAQKPLAERGGTPPPLNGQNPLSSF